MTALRVALLIAAALVAMPGVSSAAELTVEVLGIRSNDGLLHFGLYDTPETFPDKDGRLDGARVAISRNRAVAVFSGLAPGRYALAVFHDENSNGEFDQIFFGLPMEDFGFSNGAVAFFGPPRFEDAAVEIPAQGAKIVIRLD
ncbi:MAG: DUF2141 domain-containing protein [Rhodospirillales bacterium]|nr:DUF2141 domain-containing protein [Alphaproteobacteria bacterium]MBL6947882.1 DUF2141 domain-containing protein [Rhodospirillales bacterium]